MQLNILDSGFVESGENLAAVVLNMADRGCHAVSIATGTPGVSHWWIVECAGNKLLYIGTPDTFADWQNGSLENHRWMSRKLQ